MSNMTPDQATKEIIIATTMEIVNEWESQDKSGFIEDLLYFLPEDQREHVIKSIVENTPLTR